MKYMPNGMLIKQIYDRLEKNANNALRAKDLTFMQIAVLMTLQESSEQVLSCKELERHFGVAQSTVAGIVSRLEKKGYVEAFGSATDKRIKLVHITSLGKLCCREASTNMSETDELLLQGFSQEERKTLNALLVRAVNNIK